MVEDEKKKTALVGANPAAPRSMCVAHGKGKAMEPELGELVGDMRNVMAPATALRLKERKGAKLRDYSDMAPALGVTHLLAFSMNEGGNVNCKIARTPAGPTLTFKVKKFSLARQVRAIQKRPVDTSGPVFMSPPVVVTNNFGGAEAAAHIKLMRITFQNMFPAVDVGTVKLAEVRRVVLFNLLKGENDEEEVEVRHYAVRATPTGVNKTIKRVIQAKVPNLSKLNDIADYVMGANSGAMSDVSDSEGEDEASHVVLPDNFRGKGNAKAQKSALKLVELGPRMRFKLLKVERGLASGDVMYHAFVKKSAEEAAAQKNKIASEEGMKKRRREEQEANVWAKKEAKDAKKAAKKQRREDRETEAMDALRAGGVPKAKEESSDEKEDGESEDEENPEKFGGGNYDDDMDQESEEEQSGSEDGFDSD